MLLARLLLGTVWARRLRAAAMMRCPTRSRREPMVAVAPGRRRAQVAPAPFEGCEGCGAAIPCENRGGS